MAIVFETPVSRGIGTDVASWAVACCTIRATAPLSIREEAPLSVRGHISRGQFIASSGYETKAKDRIALERERIEYAKANGDKVYLTADGGRGEFVTRRAADADLRRRYPEFGSTLDLAGPVPSAERLQQLVDERAALKARVDALKRRVAEMRRK
jgi:hypothetical protein